ncbi:SDR family NAD(P)-dependent oxidoreductase [Rhizobium johnstonii]|uniref:SDR family NAD(P)-dependent oxidoreductase n=1 Tax=Rhizobium TaxID=379 RepID=UPI001030FF36|nr:SDR family oxidoreductase [Rhizobium leguminosarum]TBH46063.1 SDR family oxidoreductase [Rhizobium leguminosarum]
MLNNDTIASSTKVAIVTGGSRGLGRNTVINLARRGVDVIFTYKSGRAEAEEVAACVRAEGRNAVAIQLDVADSATFESFADKVRQALQIFRKERFDFLVNNAGTSSGMSFLNAVEEEFDALFMIHVKGPFFLTQRLLPLINDGGRIVNISSGLTRVVMNNRAAYGTMKAAVETMTRYMAFELGSRKIAVNVVAPGAIATDFSGGVVRDNPEVNKAVSNMTALGRAGLPDDIGPMIASLLSEDNRWVNAQRIEVSGGMSI